LACRWLATERHSSSSGQAGCDHFATLLLPGADHDLDVEITATVPITARTHTVTDPDRLIVDLPESLPSAGLHKIFGYVKPDVWVARKGGGWKLY